MGIMGSGPSAVDLVSPLYEASVTGILVAWLGVPEGGGTVTTVRSGFGALARLWDITVAMGGFPATSGIPNTPKSMLEIRTNSRSSMLSSVAWVAALV